jgi:hypothetical protein
MLIDRFADVRGALLPAQCVLQTAMDNAASEYRISASVEEVLMWSKGCESLQAHASGLDALLELKVDDAAQEVAGMDCHNCFALHGVQSAAHSILAAGAKPS